MTTIAQRLADIAANPLPRMTARQIIEANCQHLILQKAEVAA